MTTVYMLQYVYHSTESPRETKIIGIYSSVEKANAAAFELQKQPGFIDHPDGFELYTIELDTIWFKERATVPPRIVK